ncbi:MAG: sulfopyruvate decarboxylase subunit beta, partial [Methanoregula sp.]|nr:sulfopyruvate decarboxylase subunit beta [Methanoregula sp.]
ILAAAGIPCTIISDRTRPQEIGEAVAAAYRNHTPHVILIPPGCIDETGCTRSPPVSGTHFCHPAITYTRTWRTPILSRFDAIKTIAALTTDELLVSNIGVPSKELYAARDRPENFYMLGSYTQASGIGLGIAAVRPDKRVIVIDGDGSLLGSSILPVIGAVAPENLAIVGLDNGVFGSTGSQPRPGCDTADLRVLAMGAGFDNTWTVHTQEELASALDASAGCGPAFIHVRIKPGNSDVPTIPLSPARIRDRFMNALQT